MKKICSKCKVIQELNCFRTRMMHGKIRRDSWCNSCNKSYQKNICRTGYFKEYDKKRPWIYTYRNISGRLRKKSISKRWYFDRGIKSLLRIKDLKFLWFRDKADEMESPSIDRIDPYGNYEISNCRYIELSENCKRKQKRGKTLNQTNP